MTKRFIPIVLWSLCGLACEPFDLDKKNFPVCAKPSGEIGYTTSRLEVTFFLDRPQGDVEAVGWDLGDGKGRVGTRFTHIYEKPGTYNVSIVVANRCNDKFTASRVITVSN